MDATKLTIRQLQDARKDGVTHVTVEIDLLVMLLSVIVANHDLAQEMKAELAELTRSNDYSKGM